jgi:hypothetical protein
VEYIFKTSERDGKRLESMVLGNAHHIHVLNAAVRHEMNARRGDLPHSSGPYVKGRFFNKTRLLARRAIRPVSERLPSFEKLEELDRCTNSKPGRPESLAIPNNYVGVALGALKRYAFDGSQDLQMADTQMVRTANDMYSEINQLMAGAEPTLPLEPAPPRA